VLLTATDGEASLRKRRPLWILLMMMTEVMRMLCELRDVHHCGSVISRLARRALALKGLEGAVRASVLLLPADFGRRETFVCW